MTFDKAFIELCNGKKIYRVNPRGKKMYDTYSIKNGRIVWTERNAIVTSIASVSLLADNWEVVE